jgi:hypothetical protein
MISALFLFGKHILRLGLAHKLLDTFEKMDTINPTFELKTSMPVVAEPKASLAANDIA